MANKSIPMFLVKFMGVSILIACLSYNPKLSLKEFSDIRSNPISR